MAGSRPFVNLEDRHVNSNDSLSSSGSGSKTLPSSSEKMDMQRTCTVLITNIPSDSVFWKLTEEPGLSEKLKSMKLSEESPDTGTLVYRAAAYAEALLFRSAESLNKRHGITLALLRDQPIATGRTVRQSTCSPALQEVSSDDCMVRDARSAKKQRISAPTPGRVQGDQTAAKKSLQPTASASTNVKRESLPNPLKGPKNPIRHHLTIELSPSPELATEGRSLQTPPPSRPRKSRRPTSKLKECLSSGPISAPQEASINPSTETQIPSALESHSDATDTHDNQHDGVEPTSVPSTGISDEYVHHDTQYNLLICKRCHLAEAPNSIVKHYKMFHYEEPGVGPDTIDMLYQKYHHCGAACNLQEANLPFPCPVIPHLTVYHTFLKCGACRERFPGRDFDALKKHLFKHFTFDGWTDGDNYDWIVTSEFSYTRVFSTLLSTLCDKVRYIETVPPSAQKILGETVLSFVAPIFEAALTKRQQLFLLRGLQELSVLEDARWFTRPWTSLQSASSRSSRGHYHGMVRNPMDLKIMEVRLKNAGYKCLWDYIEDFKQIVYNSALYNGRQSKYTVIAKELEKIFDQRVTESLSPQYTTDTELAAPILPSAREFSIGIPTAEERDYELMLSTSHWNRRSKSPEPETRIFEYSDENTDEGNRHKEADREFKRLTKSRKEDSQSTQPSSTKKRKRSTVKVNEDSDEEDYDWAKLDKEPKGKTTPRKQLAPRKRTSAPDLSRNPDNRPELMLGGDTDRETPLKKKDAKPEPSTKRQKKGVPGKGAPSQLLHRPELPNMADNLDGGTHVKKRNSKPEPSTNRQKKAVPRKGAPSQLLSRPELESEAEDTDREARSKRKDAKPGPSISRRNATPRKSAPSYPPKMMTDSEPEDVNMDDDAMDPDVIDDLWPYWSLDEVGTYHAQSNHDSDGYDGD